MPQEKQSQIKFYFTQKHYAKLKEMAHDQGLSIPAVSKRLTLEYIGEPGSKSLLVRYKELEARESQLATEVGRLERDYAIMSKKLQELESRMREMSHVKSTS